MKILIVEDDENSRVLLESALGANGYGVKSAENGKIALTLLKKSLPDLIISDILMPEMDGYALCRTMKADKQLKKIPFVFYTATYTDPNDEKLALELGAAKFIVKPMEIDLFLKEIEKVLANHKTGNLQTYPISQKNQQELNKDYANVLTKKLDKKIRQLEQEKDKLSKSEAKYRRLVEALRENYFFYTHDTKDIFTYLSPSIKNVLGYTEQEFMRHCTKYLTQNPINKTAIYCTQQSIKGKKQPSYEFEIYHKNGTIHQVEVTEEPIFNQYGQVIAVEGIAHDITKRVSMEKQLAKAQEWLQQAQKMESIGNLAGGIAHDFNNILSPIIGIAEILLEDFDAGSFEHENAQEILTAGKRGRDLVKQILAFSRESTNQKIPIRIQEILNEAIKLCRATIPSNIELKHDIQNDCGLVIADPTQIHQIVMNLITNAYHSVEQNNMANISIQLKETKLSKKGLKICTIEPGKYAHLSVSDTGCGIDTAIMNKIFDPYFTTKTKGKGTGLGLTVVYGIVKNHGGHISVDSKIGRGSTFNVYIPLIKKSSDIQSIEEPKKDQTGHERILLVDDEELIVRIKKLILERLGYKVTSCTSSTETLKIFKSDPNKFDLVITDMTMPNITGDQLAKELTQIRNNIPIIICTGFSEKMNQEKAQNMGIKGFLMKPIVKSEMAQLIRQVLDEHK